MTDTVLFIFGVFITLIIIASIGALLWASIEDGRKEAVEAAMREGSS